MAFKYYKNENRYTAVSPNAGFIDINTCNGVTTITFGTDQDLCALVSIAITEIDKEDFFLYLSYPTSQYNNAIKYFERGILITQKEIDDAKERKAVYDEQKSKPYH